MEIIIYGTYEDYRTVKEDMEILPEMQYRIINCEHAATYDDFLLLLRKKTPDMVMVLADGAEGMEGIIASQTICPRAVKIWITNDKGFGIQAYRMNCAYFAVKPITEDLISKAYRAYREAGNQ